MTLDFEVRATRRPLPRQLELSSSDWNARDQSSQSLSVPHASGSEPLPPAFSVRMPANRYDARTPTISRSRSSNNQDDTWSASSTVTSQREKADRTEVGEHFLVPTRRSEISLTRDQTTPSTVSYSDSKQLRRTQDWRKTLPLLLVDRYDDNQQVATRSSRSVMREDNAHRETKAVHSPRSTLRERVQTDQDDASDAESVYSAAQPYSTRSTSIYSSENDSKSSYTASSGILAKTSTDTWSAVSGDLGRHASRMPISPPLSNVPSEYEGGMAHGRRALRAKRDADSPKPKSSRETSGSNTSGVLNSTRSPPALVLTLSERREELYAFKTAMREAFGRVDEMVDAHRAFFKTDPRSGTPIFDVGLADTAARLAKAVDSELTRLRARFRQLAADFHKAEEIEASLAESTRREASSERRRAERGSRKATDLQQLAARIDKPAVGDDERSDAEGEGIAGSGESGTNESTAAFRQRGKTTTWSSSSSDDENGKDSTARIGGHALADFTRSTLDTDDDDDEKDSRYEVPVSISGSSSTQSDRASRTNGSKTRAQINNSNEDGGASFVDVPPPPWPQRPKADGRSGKSAGDDESDNVYQGARAHVCGRWSGCALLTSV